MAAKRGPPDYKSKRRPPSRFSGWMGVFCGLSLGLLIAAIVYLKDRHADAPMAATQKAAKRRLRNTEAADIETGESGAAEEPKSYAFYDQLPKFEVVVPERDKEVKRDVRAVPETRRGTYVLQAGSYKNFADADRIRAQLALQGVESKVQKVSVDNDTWHRIRIGPISKLEELNRLRTLLRKADVDVLVIRVGD